MTEASLTLLANLSTFLNRYKKENNCQHKSTLLHFFIKFGLSLSEYESKNFEKETDQKNMIQL